MSSIQVKRDTPKNNYKRKGKKQQEYISLPLDIETLTNMCRFVISDSQYIKRYDLTQLRKLLEVIDTIKLERTSIEITDRINFIRYGLEARLDQKLNDTNSIFSYINQRFNKESYNINISDPISKEDIQFINNITSETLKYDFIFQDMDDMRDTCNEFSQTTIGHRGDIIAKFENLADTIKNQFRSVRAREDSEIAFSLKGDDFENAITDTYNKLRSPSRRLYTGMVGVNLLTNGFESGRVYMLFGGTGVGKSITLLNLAYQIKKYNKNYKPKDPTKTPCVVMLTMENSVEETIERLFDLISCDPLDDTKNQYKPMSEYDNIQEVMDKIHSSINSTPDDPIDLLIRYKPNHSVSTDYLYTLYDDLEDEGYEPICIIQDHVKRIRSIDNDVELRIELGNIVNEFKVFATLKDIPLISNSHLNRNGNERIEKGGMKNKVDIAKSLGKANIGESLLMIDNLDMGLIINKTNNYDKDGYIYMEFHCIKSRVKVNLNSDFMLTPFVKGSTIRLIEDINMPKPMYKLTLKEENGFNNYNNGAYASTYIGKPIDDPDESNIFNKASSYSPSDEFIPEFGEDNTPLNSDIPDYNNKKNEEDDKCPFIYYEDPEESKKVAEELLDILK